MNQNSESRQKDLAKAGIAAAKRGDRRRAKGLLELALQANPRQDVLWLWLASIAEDRGEARAHLRKVLEINPHRQKAIDWLERLKPKPSAPAITRRPKSVLIVDDSPTIQKMVGSILSKRGHQTHSAMSGMEALSLLQEITPDLILLDITLPVLDGFKVCRIVKKNERTGSVPVVMISGHTGPKIRAQSFEAGAVAHICKPLDAAALVRWVERYAYSKSEEAAPENFSYSQSAGSQPKTQYRYANRNETINYGGRS